VRRAPMARAALMAQCLQSAKVQTPSPQLPRNTGELPGDGP
jgi:hypothetical protein